MSRACYRPAQPEDYLPYETKGKGKGNMPKRYLTDRAKSDELLLKYIRMQRAALDMTQEELSKKLYISRSVLNQRLKYPGEFKRNELRTLFKVLRFSEEQIREVLL